MRTLLTVWMILNSCPVWADSINHQFEKGETLWFISQIYYGQGTDYQKIMKANQLTSPDTIANGKLLKIPDPLFKPNQPGFELRLSYLREKRSEALAQRSTASDSSPFEKAKAEFIGK